MSNYYTKLELICLAVLLFLVTSCMTVGRIERNCDKFEKICTTQFTVYYTDTVKIHTRDTVVYYVVHPEVKYDTVRVYVQRGLVNSSVSRLETELAWSTAQVTNSLLTHQLVQKDTTITRRLKDALRQVEILRNTQTTKTITVKENTGFASFAVKWFWGTLAVFVLVLVVLYLWKR